MPARQHHHLTAPRGVMLPFLSPHLQRNSAIDGTGSSELTIEVSFVSAGNVFQLVENRNARLLPSRWSINKSELFQSQEDLRSPES